MDTTSLLFRLTADHVLQESVVLGHDAGQVIAQALVDMSNEKSQPFNGTPSNRASLIRHMKKVGVSKLFLHVELDSRSHEYYIASTNQ